MKVALFALVFVAGVATVLAAVTTQCPDNSHFYGASGQPAHASTTTASCVCLDNPPVTANCPAPFQSNQNGQCVRNPVLTALITVQGETTQQQLVYIGTTDESSSTSGFTNTLALPPREVVFLSVDPTTGNLYGLTNESFVFRYVPSTESFFQYYGSGFTVIPNNVIPLATALTFDDHYVYVATYFGTLAKIVQLDVNNVGAGYSQVWRSNEGFGFPITHMNVFSDGTSHVLYAVAGQSIVAINLREQTENTGHNAILVAGPALHGLHFASKLTTGDTAGTTSANTTTSGSTITGTTTDSLGNLYFTQAGLTAGTYAIQKILRADIGKSPAPTKTLSSKSAASVTVPVIDKYNNLYWAAGSSSDNLSGVFVCNSVTLTSPVCGNSVISKWPVTSQQNGAVVTVTVNQIVYG